VTQEPDIPAEELQTLGEEIIAWIETECRVPEGVLIGQPIELMDWQRDAILKTYDNVARNPALHHQRRQKIRKNHVCSLLVARPPRGSGSDPEFTTL